MNRNESRTPRATYRVQLNAEFNFDQAATIVDYLADLGISHLYCSPVFQARAGSTHGYDVVDPQRISDQLGGPEGFARLCKALAGRGMGLVLDIVPNHMAACPAENPLWRDVLANGQSSRWADFFDIDWDPPQPKLKGKVLLPILEAPLEQILEAGGLSVDFSKTPLSQSSRSTIPTTQTPLSPIPSPQIPSQQIPLASIPTDTSHTACGFAEPWGAIRYRGLDLPLASGTLEKVTGRDRPTGVPTGLAHLDLDRDEWKALLDAQHYRLAHWRAAGSQINYRRFFSIVDLVAVRVEDERVFHHVHASPLAWARPDSPVPLDGLRVDHIDGLRGPAEYLARLRAACPELWIVVEKILAAEEELPRDWPVAGTTGYDFLNKVGGLFVDAAGEAAMTAFYAQFTGEATDYPAIVRQCKHELLETSFRGEWDRLVARLMAVAQQRNAGCEFTPGQFREAVRELIVAFPVYRTYLAPGRPASPRDEGHMVAALASIRRTRPDIDARLMELLSGLLLSRRSDSNSPEEADFVLRLQQLTGPVMAKGVEDTAFYRFNRLVSLNEVGGDPSRFGVSVDDFHRYCASIQARWPGTLLASSTHDTKRSEDVRARISLLSEIPEQWAATVERWSAVSAAYRASGEMPSRNDEYLMYQTLVGVWPISLERLVAFMLKAAREAKLRTCWEEPNTGYEDALSRFVAAAMSDARLIAEVDALVASLKAAAMSNMLAQTLIKCTAPGVPDFYQGTELWDLSLVDPDNRRPVDYALRRRGLAELRTASLEDVWAGADQGLPKMFVIQRALGVRRRHPDLFGPASPYMPLAAEGAKKDHVVAFARGGPGGSGPPVVTIVPRLPLRLGGDWADTTLRLPAGEWTDELSGQTRSLTAAGRLPVATLLERFPVALLTRDGRR